MENVAVGLTREWLFGGRIVTYSLSVMNSMVKKLWANEVMMTLETWRKERPYLAVHDLSKPGIGLLYLTSARGYLFNPAVSAEGSVQLQRLMIAHPDFHVGLAVLLSDHYSDLVASLEVKRLTLEESRISTKIFFERKEAIKWLLEVGADASKWHDRPATQSQ